MTNVGEDVEKSEFAYPADGIYASAAALQVPGTLHFTPSETNNCTPRFPREMKTYIYTRPCIQMVAGALLKRAKKWKQSKCPSMN